MAELSIELDLAMVGIENKSMAAWQEPIKYELRYTTTVEFRISRSSFEEEGK